MDKRSQFNIQDILELLPHRYPMVLIDRIIEIEHGKTLTAIKNVTINEPFFAGAFLVLNNVPEPLKKNMLFSSITDSKFRAPIVPGDQVKIKMQLAKIRLGAVKLIGKAYVDDKLVAEANLMANIVNRAGS